MPSFRKPKGVRTLTSGDWFYQEAAAGGCSLRPGAGNDSQISLYNDSQIGEWLWVTNISATPSLTNFFWYYSIQGTLGTMAGPCFPVVCDGGQPRGLIYTNSVPSMTPGPPVTLPLIAEFESSNPSMGAGPIAVIKPGYSLVVQAQNNLDCGFTYLVLGY